MSTPDLPTGFDEDLVDRLAATSAEIARRIAGGASLWCASSAWPHHARHVAVEFVHPVIVGKPAVRAATVDLLQIGTVARPGDVVVAIAPDNLARSALSLLAADRDLLLVAINAGTPPRDPAPWTILGVDGPVTQVAADGRWILLYHLLWELVHVCLEHGVGRPDDPDATDFLYPMVGGGDAGDEGGVLHADLVASALAKAVDSAATARASLASLGPALDAAAETIARTLASGGRVLTCGNGGSATDAAALSLLFNGRCLADDPAVLTALANDIGFDEVFARQVDALGRTGDVLLLSSTSGDSTNLQRAVAAARDRRISSVALVGGSGGWLAQADACDHVLSVDHTSVHRIQEAQAALGLDLWQRVAAARSPSSHGTGDEG